MTYKHDPTPTPRKKRPPNTGPIWVLALLAACLCAALIAGLSQRDDKPHRITEIGDAISVTPAPSPTSKPLSLALDLPALSDEQMYWRDVAAVVPRCPLCKGLDRLPISFTDNEANVYTAIVYGECSFRPFDEWGNFKVNEIGARGCSQLMGDLITHDNMWNPTLNIYDGAAYFRSCLDDAGGDIMAALRHYRGVADLEHDGQATSVFSVLRIGG